MYLPSLKQKIAETVGRLEDDPYLAFWEGQPLFQGPTVTFREGHEFSQLQSNDNPTKNI